MFAVIIHLTQLNIHELSDREVVKYQHLLNNMSDTKSSKSNNNKFFANLGANYGR